MLYVTNLLGEAYPVSMPLTVPIMGSRREPYYVHEGTYQNPCPFNHSAEIANDSTLRKINGYLPLAKPIERPFVRPSPQLRFVVADRRKQ